MKGNKRIERVCPWFSILISKASSYSFALKKNIRTPLCSSFNLKHKSTQATYPETKPYAVEYLHFLPTPMRVSRPFCRRSDSRLEKGLHASLFRGFSTRKRGPELETCIRRWRVWCNSSINAAHQCMPLHRRSNSYFG